MLGRPVLLVFATLAALSSDVAAQGTAASAPQAEPFGFRMGMSLSEVRKFGATESNERGSYTMTAAPTPHPDFETYLLLFSDKTGLCKVLAVGKTVRSSSNGMQVRSAFDELDDALRRRYGAPSTEVDQLSTGSIWDEPNDWLMALRQKERVLAVLWTRANGSLPVNLHAIMLEAKGLSSTEGYVTLGYEFANAEACIQEARDKRDEAL